MLYSSRNFYHFCVWRNCALVTSCPAVLAGNPLGWLPHTGGCPATGCFLPVVFFFDSDFCVFFFKQDTLESLGVFFQQTRGNRSVKIWRFEFAVGLFRSHESMRLNGFPGIDQPIVGIDGYTSHPPAEMVQAQRVSMAAEASCPKRPEGMAVWSKGHLSSSQCVAGSLRISQKLTSNSLLWCWMLLKIKYLIHMKSCVYTDRQLIIQWIIVICIYIYIMHNHIYDYINTIIYTYIWGAL